MGPLVKPGYNGFEVGRILDERTAGFFEIIVRSIGWTGNPDACRPSNVYSKISSFSDAGLAIIFLTKLHAFRAFARLDNFRWCAIYASA